MVSGQREINYKNNNAHILNKENLVNICILKIKFQKIHIFRMY